jgi:glycine oxidase ThiO
MGPDLIVVGGGVVGLTVALAAADEGLRVALVTARTPGEASPAAAGMLAPTIEIGDGPGGEAAHGFALAARDRYPSYLARLTERSGITVPHNRLGILVTGEPDDEGGADDGSARYGQRLDATALERLEPAMAGVAGARFFPDDGSVDNVRLLEALGVAIDRTAAIERHAGPAVELDIAGDGIRCRTANGAVSAPQLVLAAGAWSPRLDGLPRPLPIVPVRGQMLALDGAPLSHVVYGPSGYLVPRGGDETLVGATMEWAGFDARTTPGAMDALRIIAAAICPALADSSVRRFWAGLRPVTPDLLPIIGRDPTCDRLIYACGHSRNGVLLGPLTGDCVAALCAGRSSPYDLTPFAVERFGVTSAVC